MSAGRAFRALIVADAHFGWRGADQPPVDAQRAVLDHLAQRFADIDLLIDAGDAHHSRLSAAARSTAQRNWWLTVASAPFAAPLIYCPGNHELIDYSAGDPEARTCDFGGLPLRPMQALLTGGALVVTVPCLRRATLLTDEVLAFVDDCLKRHPRTPSLLIGHQAVIGTTDDPSAPDYRQLANSDEFEALLDRHPQVLAYVHGHNHDCRVARRRHRLYLSAGRLGGFVPAEGRAEFGADLLVLLLELSAERLIAQHYNATRRCWVGASHLLENDLAPDCTTTAAYSGARLQRDQRLVYWPTAIGAQARVGTHWRSIDGPLNADPGLRYALERGAHAPAHARLADFQPLDAKWQVDGARLEAVAGLGYRLRVGHEGGRVAIHLPNLAQRDEPYFAAIAAARYQVEIDCDAAYAPSVMVTVSGGTSPAVELRRTEAGYAAQFRITAPVARDARFSVTLQFSTARDVVFTGLRLMRIDQSAGALASVEASGLPPRLSEIGYRHGPPVAQVLVHTAAPSLQVLNAVVRAEGSGYRLTGPRLAVVDGYRIAALNRATSLWISPAVTLDLQPLDDGWRLLPAIATRIRAVRAGEPPIWVDADAQNVFDFAT